MCRGEDPPVHLSRPNQDKGQEIISVQLCTFLYD